MKKLKKIRHLTVLGRSEGITKELNLVELNRNPCYHVGTWMNGKNIEGIFLKEKEVKALLKTLNEEEKVCSKDTENQKFQKDYIQQSHNGTVEKEELLW